MATHSSTLTWKIPWTEEPGGLQSMGSRRATRLSDFTFTFHFYALEKVMATHASSLAWKIPGTAEPGGLPSMGSHRVSHDWSDLAAAAAAAAGFLSFSTIDIWVLISFVVGSVLYIEGHLAAFLLLGARKIPLIVKAKNISRHWEVSSEGQLYQRGNEWNEHSRVWLLATTWTPLSMPGSSVHGILQARILQWVAVSFSRGSSQPWDWTQFFLIADGFFTVWTQYISGSALLRTMILGKKEVSYDYKYYK